MADKKKNFAQLQKERQAASKVQTAARNKKAADRKANAGKAGYDKYGTKTVAQKKKDKASSTAEANRKKTISDREARDKKIKRGIQQKAQVAKIKKTISQPSTVDQTELRKKRAKETAGSSYKAPKAGDGVKDTRKPVKVKNAIKASKGMDLKAKASTDGPKKPGLKFKQSGKAKRQMDKAKKLSDRADAGAKDGSITKKKYDRLNKRAQRKAERSTGKRKSVVGTALKAVGRGAQAFGHAYAYGDTSRLKGKSVSKKNKK